MICVEGVLVAFQSLSTIKKGTSRSHFQSNEPFSKPYINSFDMNCLGRENKGKQKIIHLANIVLYLGSAILLPMI
jgi:hypothetical protein